MIVGAAMFIGDYDAIDERRIYLYTEITTVFGYRTASEIEGK